MQNQARSSKKIALRPFFRFVPSGNPQNNTRSYDTEAQDNSIPKPHHYATQIENKKYRISKMIDIIEG